jgi:hypothetical protein
MTLRAALACALMLAPAVALAQEDASAGASADIMGEWTFYCPLQPGCALSGTASLRPGATPGVYSCSITAHDVCPPLWDHTAKETCTATRAADTLSIRSRVDSLEPAPPAFGSYLPDNFSLTIVDGSNMSGALVSAHTATARFRRENGPIS